MHNKDFKRNYKTGNRLFTFGAVISTIIAFTIYGFIGWVIVKTLQHIGII